MPGSWHGGQKARAGGGSEYLSAELRGHVHTKQIVLDYQGRQIQLHPLGAVAVHLQVGQVTER